MRHFIGIDVHKRTSHIVAIDGTTELVCLDKNIRTKKERFDEILGPLAPAKVLIESSTLSRWVADHLRDQGHDVVVGDPNYRLMYASRPGNRKNDREDAKALAVACKAGHFRPVHRVSNEHRALQEMLGSRAVVIESRTRYVNRVRALHAGAGLALPSCDAGSLWSAAWRAGVPPRVASAVRPLLDMLAMVEDQLAALDRCIAQEAELRPAARLLMTVPGVGPIVALTFMAVVDDPFRFPNAHQLESYLGLVPRIHASGKPGEGGHISKRGPTNLRSLLVQAAWGFLRSTDPNALALQQWANALAQRRSSLIAVTALSRKLGGVMLAVWRDGKPFELRNPKMPQSNADAKPIVRHYRLRPPAKTAVAATD